MARGSDRIQIVVALIGVAGVVIAAWIAHRDHVADRSSATQAPPAASVPIGPPSEAAQNLSNAQARSLNAETKALDDVAGQIEAAGANRTTH